MTHSDARFTHPQRRSFAKGTSIFKEGDRADAAYIVESGSVQIFKMVSGRKVVLGTIHPWGMFGELGLIDNSPRMAGAYVVEDATCMVVSKDSIERMLDNAPDALRILIQSLVQIIRTAGQDLAEARYQLLETARTE